MNDLDWRTRVRQIFDAAMDHAPAEQEAFVRSQSQGNDALAAEVLGLVRKSGAAENMFGGRLEEATIDCVLQEGSRVGPYAIEGLLGKGSMGSVYRAKRIADFEATFAIKVLHGQDESTVSRFDLERRIMGVLRHQRVCQIHDAGQLPSGQPYLVMDYIDGFYITEYYHRFKSTISYAKLATLFAHVCDGVAVAHAHRIIHRDLKPANILISRSGDAKVCDFGVAKRLDVPLGTLAGTLVGTLEYMAPEQVDTSSGEVSCASDVYALGAILYELLVGHPPFSERSRPKLMREINAKTPPSPRRLVKFLPRDLETICLKCLAKEPRHRYQDAGELKEELEAFAGGRTISARPTHLLEKSYRWARRNPLAAAAGSLAVTLLVGLLAVSVLYGLRAQREQARLITLGNSAMEVVDEYLVNVGGEVQLMDRSRASVRRRLTENALRHFSDLAGVGVQSESMKPHVAYAQLVLAQKCREEKDVAGAEAAIEAGRVLWEELCQNEPSSLANWRSRIQIEEEAGLLYWGESEMDKAVAHLGFAATRADETLKPHLEDAPSAMMWWHVHYNYDGALRFAGEVTKAREVLTKCGDQLRAARISWPAAEHLIECDTVCRKLLAQDSIASGELDKAYPELLAEYAGYHELGSPDRLFKDKLACLETLVALDCMAERFAAAQEHIQRGLDEIKAKPALMDSAVFASERRLYQMEAEILEETKRYDEAMVPLRRALFPNDNLALECLLQLSRVSALQGKTEESEAWLLRASEYETFGSDPYHDYLVARIYCGRLEAQRSRETIENEDARRDEDLAVASLRKSIAAGFFDEQVFTQDRALDVIRPRADVQQLLRKPP